MALTEQQFKFFRKKGFAPKASFEDCLDYDFKEVYDWLVDKYRVYIAVIGRRVDFYCFVSIDKQKFTCRCDSREEAENEALQIIINNNLI